MREHFAFQDVPEPVKGVIEDYFHRKETRLGRLLRHYSGDSVRLRLVVHGPRSPRNQWEVRAVLGLPMATMVAESTSQSFIEPALDEVAETLWRELREHRFRTRKEHILRKKSRRQLDLEEFTGRMKADVERKRRDAFISLLQPGLGFLASQARREIKVLETEGQIPKNSVTYQDIVADALLLAWERFSDRPMSMPLDAWLARLVHETLEREVREARGRAGEETPPSAAPAPVEGEEEFDVETLVGEAPPPEPITWEDLFPDERMIEPLRKLDIDEERELILASLAGIPPRDRVAFSLRELEGYDDEEISLIQNRSVDEVRAAVESVRQRLREAMRSAEEPSAKA